MSLISRMSAILLLCTATQVINAAPVNLSDQKTITTRGQKFDFAFGGLQASGTGGVFSLTLNGDYSEGASLGESASATIDLAGGSLVVRNNTGDGVFSNTIDGLSLLTYSETQFDFDDWELRWTFSMTDTLLNLILASGDLSTSIQNGTGVDPFARINPDFVRVGFSFNEVPEPTSLGLVGLALAGLGIAQRRRAN